MEVNMNAAYRPSENVVARKIEDEIIIVPLTAGVGESEDDLYTLNDTGKEVWGLLNGSLTLNEVVNRLSNQYEAPESTIERDVTALVAELLQRRILV